MSAVRTTAVAGALLAGALVLAACSADPGASSSPSAGGATSEASAGPGATGEAEGADGSAAGAGGTDGTDATDGADGTDSSDGTDGTDGTAGDGDAAAPGTAGDALPTAPPVDLDEEASFGTGVTATVVRVDAIEAEARGPGEISGPALAFEVEVTNGADAEVSLDAVTVNLTDADGAPGLPMTGSPADPFGGVLAPGRSTTGVYVFTVDSDARDDVTLEVAYTTEAHVVLFRGDPAE